MATKEMTRLGLITSILCVLSPLSLPIGIVPISLTNLVIFLSCYVVGMKRTVLCVFLYLLIGLAGFPVFSGFSGGLTKLLGPTGGYLFGFIFMAWIAGYFIEKHLRYQLIGMILGASICSLIGTFWLSFVTNLSLTTAIGLGVTPFIVGDLIKILIAMFIGPKLKRIEFR